MRIKFLGPYEVVKVNGQDRYHVQKVGQVDGPIKTMTAADSMKRWVNGEEDEDSKDELKMAESLPD